MDREPFSPDHPSCTAEEAPGCKNFGVKCWHCSIEGSLYWSPNDGKTRHHTFWERKQAKLEAKRAEGKGKMGGKGSKTKDRKQVLAAKAEKRIKGTLNKKFEDKRFEELFRETISSGRIRNDGDLNGYCSLIDVKSTTRSSSWITEKDQLEKAQAQAHAHKKLYGIIINENNTHDSIAVMSVPDLTHLFQYLAYLERRNTELEQGQ